MRAVPAAVGRVALRRVAIRFAAICPLALWIAAALAPAAAAAPGAPVLVFAAASLQGALDEVAAGWDGGEVAVSYASSATLARQIEQGAPADLFFSADVAWMDHLADRGLIRPETRRDLLGNRMVLIAHGRGAGPVELGPETDLAGLLGGGRLAVADVDAAPAGRYARAALESLGLWEAVADRLAPTENVRAALALVARGEAPFGVVYATDAGAEDRVSVVATFPADSHPPIVYPVALVAGRDSPGAAAFAEHLASEAAGAVFSRHGFTLLD